MSAERLRQAATVLRERATFARSGRWTPQGARVNAERSWGQVAVAVCEGSLPEGCGLNATYIATMHPSVGLALADWLDAEVAVQESMQPMAEFVSLVINQAGGPAGYVRILHDDEGQPQMQADSSPAALRLADQILGDRP